MRAQLTNAVAPPGHDALTGGFGPSKYWMICPAIGRSSEPWMYRQAQGLMPGQLRVICWAHQQSTIFPESGFSTHIVPSRSGRPLKDRGLNLRRWMGRATSKYEFPPRARVWIEAFLRRDRPAAILCQYGHLAIATLRLSIPLGISTFVHFHGSDITARLRDPVYQRCLRRALPQFAGVVCVARYQRDWLLRNGAPEERVRVIPCGVPLSDYRTEDRQGRTGCRFLAVGRLVEKKAPELTIRAFHLCAATNPDATLTLVGEGERKERCEQLVEQLGLTERVRFAGSLPPDRVAEELTAADVFVQHSVTASDGDREGWPVAIAEAAASGLPVIATRHAGIVDQIIDGESGLLCEEYDWRKMGSNMTRLADSPQLRCRFGLAARKRMELFDSTSQIAQLRTFLDTASDDWRAKVA